MLAHHREENGNEAPYACDHNYFNEKKFPDSFPRIPEFQQRKRIGKCQTGQGGNEDLLGAIQKEIGDHCACSAAADKETRGSRYLGSRDQHKNRPERLAGEHGNRMVHVIHQEGGEKNKTACRDFAGWDLQNGKAYLRHGNGAERNENIFKDKNRYGFFQQDMSVNFFTERHLT